MSIHWRSILTLYKSKKRNQGSVTVLHFSHNRLSNNDHNPYPETSVKRPFAYSRAALMGLFQIMYIYSIHENAIYGSDYNFIDRWLLLTRKLLNQGFWVVKLNSSLQRFYRHHHHNIGNRYGIYVSQIDRDMFRLS
jgi:hypothetical protein